ncbi:glycine betaine/L-proline ABC transporter substrate-binding protein ProX [Mesorhizobium sp. M1339]|uniref:glycine betaine/L-proline ABC transporter substrate-binding protein ProX n=1 Tax=Mesorhizobium sp. M1339 TaxID=2957086 RepID=UPI00333B74B0
MATLLLSLAVASLSLLSLGNIAHAAETRPGAGKTVIPSAQSNDPEEMFQTYLVGMGLRDLGYEVKEPIVAQMQATFVAVANGDATYYAAFWDPLHNSFLANLGTDKVALVGGIVANSIQGYLIDKKTADAHFIKTIEQFADPAIAKLFDADGSGKATLYGCDPGWGCERVIEHQLDAYNLRKTVKHKQGSYTAIIGDAIERIKAGQPTLYYTWTPLWLSSVMKPGTDVTWLTVDKTSLPADQANAVTDVDGIGNLGFPVNQQRILANADFLKENPAARKWFEQIHIPLEDINAENLSMHNGENTDPDIKRHAEAWKAAHQTQWDAWLKDALSAK